MKKFILLIFMCGSLSNVFSQKFEMAEDELTKIVTSRTIQSSNKSGFVSNNSFTKLSASNEGTSADANINYSVKAWNLSLDVSTPISTKGQRVKPLSLAGLSNRSSLNLGAQKIFWGKDFSWDPKLFTAARIAIGKDTGDFKTNNLTELEKAKFYKIADINWGTNYFVGVKGGLEQQEFNYISNPSTFDNAEVSKTALNISGSFGIMAKWGIVAITFSHQNGYQAANPIKYYIPVNTAGVQVEKELSPAAPKKAEQ